MGTKIYHFNIFVMFNQLFRIIYPSLLYQVICISFLTLAMVSKPHKHFNFRKVPRMVLRLVQVCNSSDSVNRSAKVSFRISKHDVHRDRPQGKKSKSNVFTCLK